MADTSSTTSFKADISQLKSAMQQAKRQVALANSEFKAASASMDDWSTNSDGLKAKLKQLTTTLDSQKKQLSLLEDEYEKTTTEYGENSAAADRVKIAINNMKASIANTESQLDKYETELKDCEEGTGKFSNELDDSEKSMQDADDNVKTLSDGFSVMKGAMADLVAYGIKSLISGLKDLADAAKDAFVEFDDGYDNIISKTGATGDALEELEGVYSNVTQSVITDFGDAGNAIGELNTKFGVTGDELETLTEQFIKFADLNDTDVVTAIDSAQSALTAWGLSAEDAGDYLDMLNDVSQRTGASVDDLSTQLSDNVATLKDMGFNISDAAEFLGNLDTAGIDSTTVMTGLKKALTNAADEGKTTKEALQELQESMANADSDTEALSEAIDLFGSKSGPAIADACKEGRISFEELGTSMDDYKGNVENTYEATQDGADKITLTWQGMKSNLGSFMSDLLDKYSPQIETVLGQVEEAFKNIMEYVAEHAPEITETISDLITDFADGLVWLVENFDDILDTAKTLITVLAAVFVVSKIASFVSSVMSVVTAIKSLKTAAESATIAQKLLNAAQNAMPVAAITAGIAALAAGIVYLCTSTEDVHEPMVTLTEDEQAQVDKVNELAGSYDSLRTSIDNNVSAIETEYDHYESLADELGTLVDANGKVKEGYEERVSFIVNELNDAVGTELELTDGVIQNYSEEKDAIYDLIDAKKANAVLAANEEAYTTAIQNEKTALQDYIETRNLYNEKVDDMNAKYDTANYWQSMSISKFAEMNGLEEDAIETKFLLAEAQQKANDEYEASVGAVGEARTALSNAEETYVGYQATIQNYEGLSSAIISGDADKINESLENMTNNFITAEIGTRDTLENQLEDYTTYYNELNDALASGNTAVTEEMVAGAKNMVDKAEAELKKIPENAEEYASNGAKIYATTFSSASSVDAVKTNTAKLTKTGVDGLSEAEEDFRDTGKDSILDYVDGMGSVEGTLNAKAKGLSGGAVDSLNEGQESNSPSKATKRSGEYFGEGYINGMDSKESAVYQKAYSLAQKAYAGLKAGQEEGSPSKLTLQSGKYFTQGYINGISSQEKALVSSVKQMVTTALKTATNLKGFNFSEVAQNAADYLANTLSDKTTYMINKINYQNEKKLAEFDAEISRLESKKSAKSAELQAQIDASTDDAVKNQITAQKNAVEAEYDALIATQNKYKTAYQTASGEMLSEFSTAINAYSSKAQELINNTISGVESKYQALYDELTTKQDALTSKLKGIGTLYDVSGAGVMTINDIQEQTKQIKEYSEKLQNIKKKVSSELFDEIAEMDIKEGSAYIDRLLAMSSSDLKAYSDAYVEKLRVSESLASKTYKSDFNKVASDYKKELTTAMNKLPKELEKLGTQSMKGFLSGLTKNTDYMDKEVKTFVESMVSSFKSYLKIKSPSKVMEEIGIYTGEGFAVGLQDTIGMIQDATNQMISAVSSPIESSVADVRGIVGGSDQAGGAAGSVVNNYNLTQNNTSPKPLSALDTYQARRRQIELMKAFT
jgi:phage-related minor tail protein